VNTDKKRLRVGVLFGGRSSEHEVSLASAASVIRGMDPDKYEPVPIGITKEGHWLVGAGAQKMLPGKDLVYGQSITDACIGWDETKIALQELATAVRSARS